LLPKTPKPQNLSQYILLFMDIILKIQNKLDRAQPK